MNEKEIKEYIDKLLHMNQRLNLILGYAMGFIFTNQKTLSAKELEQYNWLKCSIENIIYLDKPLPPIP